MTEQNANIVSGLLSQKKMLERQLITLNNLYHDFSFGHRYGAFLSFIESKEILISNKYGEELILFLIQKTRKDIFDVDESIKSIN